MITTGKGQLDCGWSDDHEKLRAMLLDTVNKTRSAGALTSSDLRQAVDEIKRRRQQSGEPAFDVNAVAIGESLATAAAFCSYDHLQVLMEFGLNVQARQGPSRSQNGTLLHNPTLGTPIAKLLDLGLEVDALCDHGMTPLHYHAKHCSPESIAELLRRGANPNTQSKLTGATPLMLAAQCWENLAVPAVVQTLASAGADLEIKSKVTSTTAGMTAMHWAASNPSNIGVLALARAGANLDSEDAQGLRPLHHAAMKDRNTIFTLVALGASPWGVYSPKSTTHNLMHGSRLQCAFKTGNQDVLAEHLKRFPDPSDEEVKKAQTQFKTKHPDMVALLSSHIALKRIESARLAGKQLRP